VLDVRVHARRPLVRNHSVPGNRLEGDRANEPSRRPRHDRDDVVSLFLQKTSDFDGLVSADAAGDTKCDESHVFIGTSR
jgi:hypothetical protein